MFQSPPLRQRARAAGWHLLISAGVATLAAALVFGVWYPGPYRLFSGGQSLFFLLSGVDVTLGPLLTFVIFDRRKSWRHLGCDLIVIGFVQVSALVYGLRTVYEARPIATVFEVDRFRVVSASEVYLPELQDADPKYRRLPVGGPWLLGTRTPSKGAEAADALLKGVAGIDIGQRPIFWQPYAESAAQAVQRSRPIDVLLKHYPSRESEFRESLSRMSADPSITRFLPLTARGDWVVVIDPNGKILGYLQADAFF